MKNSKKSVNFFIEGIHFQKYLIPWIISRSGLEVNREETGVLGRYSLAAE